MDSKEIFERIEKTVEQTYSSFPASLSGKNFTFIRKELQEDSDIEKVVNECCKKDIDSSSVNVVLAYKLLSTNSAKVEYVDVLINSIDFKVFSALAATFFIQNFNQMFSSSVSSPLISYNPFLKIEGCLPIRMTFN